MNWNYKTPSEAFNSAVLMKAIETRLDRASTGSVDVPFYWGDIAFVEIDTSTGKVFYLDDLMQEIPTGGLVES